MSLELANSKPKVEIKTSSFSSKTELSIFGTGIDIDIPMQDFLAGVLYVLTNTKLEPNDPRLEFLEAVKTLIKTNDNPTDPTDPYAKEYLESTIKHMPREVAERIFAANKNSFLAFLRGL